MKRNQSKPNPKSNVRTVVIAGSAVVALIAIGWWMSRKPVVLDEHGYDVTIALYRVCNQRSAEGLRLIEQRLHELASSNDPVDESYQALTAMIALADEGKWHEAAMACRQALEDQVQR
ncbi:hypothetical protein [Aporhodopirellula aestuarii]|uniref:Tetratricopeptide repeat protein n=1 Tax=Aporhodopirellula aestuarii TaxID=2950107 RepID=A0ABT0UEB2_9BACT|nr:hypothetical protein [Aporhodopirellula aestuarii]MCM2375228.1 hypothetical protein [Aporhodopirellula aestuarii]